MHAPAFRCFRCSSLTGVALVSKRCFMRRLWPVSLLPSVVGLAAAPYSIVATALGFIFIGLSALFARDRSMVSARRLFLFSITYLPLLWGALVADRLWI
jgi:heme O synthase-like polyprenyltransferase